jgi:SAM-dependent methyltransferase
MTDWDERYRLGDTPWEKGQAAPPLLEVINRCERDIWGDGAVLVPGCGLGHDVRALAGVGVQALGLDLSPLAVEMAREFPVVGGEIYEVGNFLDAGLWADRKFSAMWEHTCFCAIDPAQRQAYAEAAGQLLIDGGVLIGVFFITPFDPGEDHAGPPFATTIEELDQRFAPWFERIGGWVPERAYPGREGREWIGLFRKVSNRSVVVGS